MSNETFDFSGGKRGPVIPEDPSKERITIRIDRDLLEWFRAESGKTGQGGYQTLINAALRGHVERAKEPLENTLRRVIREELRAAS